MKPFRRLLAALLLFPSLAWAQGVRMSSDFLPLQVGNRWDYDVTDEAGQKVGQLAFAVDEYTIIDGTSFYVLTGFPFSTETGEPIRLVRYDRNGRYFVRKLGDDQGPLFLNDDSETEVTESDSSGLPKKFILRAGTTVLTFERGVGIIEARLNRPEGTVIAKLTNVHGADLAGSGPGPVADSLKPPSRDRVLLPPVVEPNRREPVVASVTSSNPRIDVAVNPSAGGYRIAMVVTNTSDKLLPFQFNSGQTYDFLIHDASGKEVWRWSNGNFFTQVLRRDSIRADGMWQFEVVWNGKDNDGASVPSGRYSVTAILTSMPPVQASPVTLDVP